jgi:hypothetical protein
MMNLRLNLLPPRKKRALECAVNFLFAKGMLELVIFFVIIITTALIWSWILAQEEFISVASSTVLVEREYSAYNEDVKNANRLIRNIGFADRGYMLLTPKITELMMNLPGNIRLNSLQIDRRTQTITISGTALTRNALIDYAETLKKIPWLGSVETLASELFQKENISFEFKTTINKFPELPGSGDVKNKPNAVSDE